jgi:hypothetical protein
MEGEMITRRTRTIGWIDGQLLPLIESNMIRPNALVHVHDDGIGFLFEFRVAGDPEAKGLHVRAPHARVILWMMLTDILARDRCGRDYLNIRDQLTTIGFFNLN